jgi:hypothetical protein
MINIDKKLEAIVSLLALYDVPKNLFVAKIVHLAHTPPVMQDQIAG